MTHKEVPNDVQLRILKIGSCPSLSGRSELTYHVGCDAKGDIHLRVVANTGSGQFNADWVGISVIEKLLAADPSDQPMSSAVLHVLFRGKSSNSSAFLFAVLKAETLVSIGAEKDSGYLIGDIDTFKQTMSALIASGNHLDAVPSSPEAPKRKRKEPI